MCLDVLLFCEAGNRYLQIGGRVGHSRRNIWLLCTSEQEERLQGKEGRGGC